MNTWYTVFTTHRKEATNGHSRHLTVPDTGPASGVSAAVTDA
jgi:hypothetical protein